MFLLKGTPPCRAISSDDKRSDKHSLWFRKTTVFYSLAVTSCLNNQLRLRAQSGSCAARRPNPESLEESAFLVGIFYCCCSTVDSAILFYWLLVLDGKFSIGLNLLNWIKINFLNPSWQSKLPKSWKCWKFPKASFTPNLKKKIKVVKRFITIINMML